MHLSDAKKMNYMNYVSLHKLVDVSCWNTWFVIRTGEEDYLTLPQQKKKIYFLQEPSTILQDHLSVFLCSILHNLKSCISVILLLIIFSLKLYTEEKKYIGILSVAFSLHLLQWLMSAPSSYKLSYWIRLKPCLQCRAIFSFF